MAHKTYHNGFEGDLLVDVETEVPGTFEPVSIDIINWSGSDSNEPRRTTSTGDYDPVSGDCYEGVYKGTRKMEASVEIQIYDETTPWSLGIKSGAMLRNVDLRLHQDPDSGYFMPEAYVTTQAVESGGMDGLNAFTFSIVNNGIFYGPGDTRPAP